MPRYRATLDEANQLLAAGDYRVLNMDEVIEINAGWSDTAVTSLPPIPPSPKNWRRLRRYLPDALYDKVELAPRSERADLCLPHLGQLLQTVVTYVPRQLAIALLQKPLPPEEQKMSAFLEGTLLFADISGFTKLAETLRDKGGKEGAEEVTRVVNEYLDAMLGILFKHNGRLVKFGGDAMLCLFAGAEQDAMNAIWAAWDMKRVMAKEFAQTEALQEIFNLDMKVGEHSGPLFAAAVGNAEHMEYILTGSVVEYTAQAESAARRGDIVVSDRIYQQTAAHIDAEPLPDQPEFFRLLAVDKKPTAALSNPWLEVTDLLAGLAGNLWSIVDRLDALTPYLPAGVLPNLVYDPAQREVDGQHRQVTVLFANFTGMSDIIDAYGAADPAGIAAELNAYFCAMQEEAAYYGGAVNKVDLYDQGDKLMITFGAPVAYERDARRAALTALAMQQAMSALSTPMAAGLLSQRIGIHSGYVFAGNVGSTRNNRREYTVMGDAVNLAARLMAAALPEQIWISQPMWRQIETDFAAQSLPPLTLKGIGRPVPAYQLLNARDSLVRQRATRDLRSAIVGREAELDALLLHFDELLFGAGKQIIAVTGEGGVGKMRLMREWRQKTAQLMGDDGEARWLTGYGRSYGQRAHGIFIDLLEDLLGINAADASAARLQKLSAQLRRHFIGQAAGWLDEFSNKLAYLGQFLGLDLSLREGLSERATQLEAEPLQLQIRLTLCDLLAEAARQQPLVLVLEDLHWADEASLELLRFIINQLPDDTPILFCLIFRLQRQHRVWQTWHDLERGYPDFCQHLALTELRSGDGRTLFANLLQTTQLPAEFQTLVLDATDGNPLYIEEVLHTLIEDGTLLPAEDSWQLAQSIADIRVPDTLYQIIQSRIDDLDFSSPGARRLLWLAAILGDSFTEDLLLHLFLETGRDKSEFLRHLRALRNADMLQRARVQHVEGKRPGYQFRHGLVRQVAYENMLISKRRNYHTQVAIWLEKTYADRLEPHYDALAYHYDQGRQWNKAFVYHWRVGKRDARAYANESVIAHLQRALQIAPSALPVPTACELGRVQFELGKAMVLGGEYEEALSYLQTAYDTFGKDGDEAAIRTRAAVCYEIGRVYENKGGADNLQTALNWRDKGLALLPKLPASTLWAGSSICVKAILIVVRPPVRNP